MKTLKILKKLIGFEQRLVIEARSSGERVIKPSLIMVGVVGILYLFSRIDIIPDFLGTFGYLDDLLILIICVVYIVLDLMDLNPLKMDVQSVKQAQYEEEVAEIVYTNPAQEALNRVIKSKVERQGATVKQENNQDSQEPIVPTEYVEEEYEDYG